jgi:hypothetical protein
MHITGGAVQSQGQHRFERSEERIDLRAQTLPAPQAPQPSAEPADPASIFDENFSLLRALVESLIGEQIDTLEVHGNAPRQSAGNGAAAPVSRIANASAIAATTTHIRESELTEVAFQGRFDTADGKAIEIDLHYKLERHYEATTFAVAANQGTQRDPLILNFNGRGVELTPQQTRFDLDSNGEAEAIPTLGAGSAYLALDLDDNGAIDRGNELFGPTTNNGYAELAKWDSDGNGFIDSADPVFDRLRLFRPGAPSASGELQTLAERDVGAIFLGAAASEARLTDTRNQSLGQLRATGFYLTNSGGTGLVQELDLTV